VTFAARIALAIAGVVLVAMAVVAVGGGSRVRQTYLAALRGSLEARIDAVAQQQGDRTARAREEAERLVRAPRLLATVIAGDGADLLQTAADELRGALERAGEGAGFVFVSDTAELARSPGLAPDAAAAGVAAALASTSGQAESSVTYAVCGGVPFEVLAAPIVDRAEDSVVGALALCSPVRFPAPLTLPDGTVLEAGLALGGVLYGTGLPAEARAEVGARFAAGDAEASVMGTDEPGLAIQRPLPTGGAALAVVAGLGPMRAAERGLVFTGAAATAVALVVGLASAVAMGRGLSRPVKALGDAAVRIESGDFAVRVPARGEDELSQLGRRFNAMAEGLAQREKYRRVLDAVADPDVAAELMAGKLDLGGAEQEVGILFCDIRGFTSLTEGKSPQSVIAMLNEHMTLLTEVAYAHGGTVDKFVGDLIMVTFGAPRPAADDALRMARCARAMVDARAAANVGAGQPILIGIGCAYGKVVAGCMGSAKRLDYTVLGERVNLAARLCSKAPAMHVYVDAGTRAALGPGPRLEPLPPIEAKGFSRPVEAFDLLSMEAPA
jgi:class 3 adenylate cyclase